METPEKFKTTKMKEQKPQPIETAFVTLPGFKPGHWDPSALPCARQRGAGLCWPLLTQCPATAGGFNKEFNHAEHPLPQSREETLELCGRTCRWHPGLHLKRLADNMAMGICSVIRWPPTRMNVKLIPLQPLQAWLLATSKRGVSRPARPQSLRYRE